MAETASATATATGAARAVEMLERLGVELAERRAPALATAPIQGGWAGFYDMSPDGNAMIGEAKEVSRFLYATGFSGHGFLQAPATGEILRDLVLGRRPFVDIAPLSVERFSDAMLRPEYNIV